MSESFILESQIRLPYRYALGKWYGAFLLGLTEERLVGSRCGGITRALSAGGRGMAAGRGASTEGPAAAGRNNG